jgi:hypothetical protein
MHTRIAILLLFLMIMATGCLCGTGGTVCTINIADSSFDPVIQDPSTSMMAWIQQHYTRMLVYSPFFDSRLSWYPNGWAYKDVYAIYVGSSLAAQRPEWILRDAAGNALYIPYACSGGTCPQYAADVGNPSFRANWISAAGGMLSAGYAGLFEDDFNMRLQIGDGSGNLVTPMNPRTGQLMTDDEWRGYMADFATEIRNAFPTAELVQNQAYYFAPAYDPNVIRATQQTNYVWIERAFNDPGLVGGTGPFGFETLLKFIDAIHDDGAGAVEEIQTPSGPEYALACYFLTSTGNDGIVNPYTSSPTSWWESNDVNLGNPKLPQMHYRWNGLFRRDFTRGTVLVNQPGSSQIAVDLGATYRRLDGSLVTRVAIGPADGVVLLKP